MGVLNRADFGVTPSAGTGPTSSWYQANEAKNCSFLTPPMWAWSFWWWKTRRKKPVESCILVAEPVLGIGIQVSNAKKPGCLEFWGVILPTYLGIIIDHDKDHYYPTSIILESKSCFFVYQVIIPFRIAYCRTIFPWNNTPPTWKWSTISWTKILDQNPQRIGHSTHIKAHKTTQRGSWSLTLNGELHQLLSIGSLDSRKIYQPGWIFLYFRPLGVP